MAKKTEEHIHKLKRIKFKSGNAVYFCALDCNFKIQVPLSLGKKTICWRCGNPFTMNEYSIRLARPHCEKCHKSKDGDSHESDGLHVSHVIMDAEVLRPTEASSLADRLAQVSHSNKISEVEEDEI